MKDLGFSTEKLLTVRCLAVRLDTLLNISVCLNSHYFIFFLGTNGDHFTYDTTWGGLVTINAMNDHSSDFGQVRFRQLHFGQSTFCPKTRGDASLDGSSREKLSV